jgi:sulfide:quinone oxidoreductase
MDRMSSEQGVREMQVRRVTDEISVAAQITADDVADIAAAGFAAIVCNRPDGEAPGQAPYADIEVAAKAAGLEIVWQPVVSGAMSDADGARFGEIVAGLPKPVLAYCRTGTRCTALWSLSQAPEQPTDEIVRQAAEAGYDMRGLALRLDAIRTAGK